MREMDARANRYANWALGQGIGRGDARGAVDGEPARLYLRLAGPVQGRRPGGADQHQSRRLRRWPIPSPSAGASHAIVGAELADEFPRRAVRDCSGTLGRGRRRQSRPLRLAAASGHLPRQAARAPASRCKDRAFFIYTSGTTGLPKAANFSHMRMLFMMSGFVGALRPRESDRIYNPLPLYHSTGGVCAVGLAFFSGGALILKRKFSVHEFWGDIHKYGATMFEYIGELCRYLLNAPPSPLERDHTYPRHHRQWAAARNLARVPDALRHSPHRGILWRHRRQCLHAEL